MKNTVFTLIIALIGFNTAFSQSEKDSVKVHFRVSDTHIDPEYNGNGATLDSIFKKLETDSLLYGPTHRLRSVKVTGAASPEGSVQFNRYLSEKRADAIFNEFRSKGLLPDSIASFTYLGRDWHGLRDEVKSDGNVPFQEDVLSLLDIINGSNPPAHPLAELKSLHGGVPYRYLLDNLFPELRASRLTVEYDRLYPAMKIPEMPLSSPSLTPGLNGEILPLPVILGEVNECRPFYMALKTNM
ncbi:MAG: hypothetical protein K2L11_04405, partial [Muribaculaceae bacterium]|nr:hypothetical protein [Muribaculaceae bacterium]